MRHIRLIGILAAAAGVFASGMLASGAVLAQAKREAGVERYVREPTPPGKSWSTTHCSSSSATMAARRCAA
jgi:hypothetical protein